MIDEASALDGVLEVGGIELSSRLIVGTGKYESNEVMVDAIRASGAEMVTVALGTWGGEVRLLTIIKLAIPTDEFSPFYNDPYGSQHVEPWLEENVG